MQEKTRERDLRSRTIATLTGSPSPAHYACWRERNTQRRYANEAFVRSLSDADIHRLAMQGHLGNVLQAFGQSGRPNTDRGLLDLVDRVKALRTTFQAERRGACV